MNINHKKLNIVLIVIIILMAGGFLYMQNDQKQIENNAEEVECFTKNEFEELKSELSLSYENKNIKQNILNVKKCENIIEAYDSRWIENEKFDAIGIYKKKNIQESRFLISLNDVVGGDNLDSKVEKIIIQLRPGYTAKGIITRDYPMMLTRGDSMYFEVYSEKETLRGGVIAGYHLVVGRRNKGGNDIYQKVNNEDLKNIINRILKEDGFYDKK